MSSFSPRSRSASRIRQGRAWLAILLIAGVATAPFVIWGEEYALPLLKACEAQTGWLMAIAILLLAADSVAPVPATLVIMFLAAKAGWLAGIVGGTMGLCAGVLVAGYLGRAGVGRLAPKLFPAVELLRLRKALQRRLGLTLACLRSVPIAAETSVIVAAAMDVPIRKIFRATLLPNFLISVVYSVAADDSFITAWVAFLATVMTSYATWRFFERRRDRLECT